MAADLVRRKVAVIAANTPAAPVAKAATTEIPIVFVSTGDPVIAGIVASFNRPGGNVTGVGLLGLDLETKRLGLLHQLVPGTMPIGVLVNPKNPAADLQLRELQEAAGVIVALERGHRARVRLAPNQRRFSCQIFSRFGGGSRAAWHARANQ
jgi:putative tryptophan/tyrosine transport system substrate-binding protein